MSAACATAGTEWHEDGKIGWYDYECTTTPVLTYWDGDYTQNVAEEFEL